MSGGKRVLAVMAHPDDVEILVSGVLFNLKERGWEVGIISMTSGDCGSLKHGKEEISRIRYAEAQAAAQYLGAWYECGRFLDLEIFLNADSLRRMVELMRRFGPDVLITHSPTDYMVDHEETSRIVRTAAFGVAMPLYQTRQVPPAEPSASTPALYYADPVEGINILGERILPHFYVDITDQIERKKEMLACHSSQREWLREYHGIDEYLNRMEEWAAAHGRRAGVPYAEGLRQHLGHGYPREPILQEALGDLVRPLPTDAGVEVSP